jgi:hypothetical protein
MLSDDRSKPTVAKPIASSFDSALPPSLKGY